MSEYRVSARLNDQVHLDIYTEDIAELANALVFFGLASNTAQPAPAPAPAAEEPKAKKPRKPAATQPVAEAAPAEAAPAETAVESPSEGNEPAVEASAPETPVVPAASSTVSATPAEAAEAVRAYGAKHGILAARELLQRFGFSKTSEITADKAGAVVEAARV